MVAFIAKSVRESMRSFNPPSREELIGSVTDFLRGVQFGAPLEPIFVCDQTPEELEQGIMKGHIEWR